MKRSMRKTMVGLTMALATAFWSGCDDGDNGGGGGARPANISGTWVGYQTSSVAKYPVSMTLTQKVEYRAARLYRAMVWMIILFGTGEYLLSGLGFFGCEQPFATGGFREVSSAQDVAGLLGVLGDRVEWD